MDDAVKALLPVHRVSEQDYALVTTLCAVRSALHFASRLYPVVDGVFSADEINDVLSRLARIEAKLTFKMGTTDERDLALALALQPPAGTGREGT